MGFKTSAMSIHDLIRAFLAHLKLERGAAANTVAAYGIDLAQFADFTLDREPELSASSLTQRHAVRFIESLLRNGYASSSIARKTAALRTFARFAHAEGYLAANFAEDLDVRRVPQRLPRSLTAQRMESILEATTGRRLCDVRDRAILELLYSSGMRVSELAALTPADVDLDAGLVRCIGKGNKERLVPIGEPAVRWLRTYLTRRRARAARRTAAHEPLFTGSGTHRLTRAAIWGIVRRAALRAGIDQRVTPHMLRHTFATHMLAGGADLRVIQEILGHAQVATTQIYTHVDRERLRRVYDQAHPRA